MEHTPRRSVLRHAGETIVHLGETIEGDFATLRSKIVTMKRAEISVDYRLYRSANRWVAIDVALENVSVVADYRQQFDRVIRTTSFATLLNRIVG